MRRLKDNQYIDRVVVSGPVERKSKLVAWINKRWGFFPKTFEDPVPPGLPDVHHRLHGSTQLEILVTVDKNGEKTFEIL